MAAFYADEGFPLAAVEALRPLGHDVLTALEAGQATRRIPDDAVLESELANLGSRPRCCADWTFAVLSPCEHPSHRR